MLSPRGFQELNRKVGRNEEKIHILQTTNEVLRERNDLESNFKNLSIKMSKLEKEEQERQEQHDKSRKHYLAELEAKGAQLCKEHGKILHQVEHMQWHLEGCKHKPCHKSKENLSHHHHHHHHSHHGSEKKLNTSGGSSAATATNTTIGGGGSVISQTTPRPSQLSNLRNSSERIIKEIIELRKRSHILQERLEHEVKRKKDMEKKMSDIRKDISRQKKSLSMRRATPLPPPTTLPPLKKGAAMAAK